MTISAQVLGSLRTTVVGEVQRNVAVLMHGFGASGQDLVGLAEVFANQDCTFVFPEAPLALSREYGPGARAWWPIDMARLQLAMMSGAARDIAKEDPAELPVARAKVLQLISELREQGAENIVLGGFSQGAMLAADIALTTNVALSGLLLWSGSLLREAVWQKATTRSIPLMMSHGEHDPILPFENAKRLYDLLQEKGYQGPFVPFRGAHEIPPKAIAQTQVFLETAFAKSADADVRAPA